MKLFRKIGQFIYFSTLLLGCKSIPESVETIEVNGQRLLYTCRGPVDGKPVLLIHGNGGSHKSMQTQAIQLAKAGYRVYSPDSRGQGANAPLEEYHYADMASDFLEFIDKLSLGHPMVAGWSDGGIIALMMEMARPGTCGLICAAGANLTPDCGEGFEEFKAWILEQGTPLAMMMLEEPNIDPSELAVIKCPSLITVGEKDLISVEHTKLISDNIPDSKLIVFKGASHSSYIKKNPRLGKAMLEFMEVHNY